MQWFEYAKRQIASNMSSRTNARIVLAEGALARLHKLLRSPESVAQIVSACFDEILSQGRVANDLQEFKENHAESGTETGTESVVNIPMPDDMAHEIYGKVADAIYRRLGLPQLSWDEPFGNEKSLRGKFLDYFSNLPNSQRATATLAAIRDTFLQDTPRYLQDILKSHQQIGIGRSRAKNWLGNSPNGAVGRPHDAEQRLNDDAREAITYSDLFEKHPNILHRFDEAKRNPKDPLYESFFDSTGTFTAAHLLPLISAVGNSWEDVANYLQSDPAERDPTRALRQTVLQFKYLPQKDRADAARVLMACHKAGIPARFCVQAISEFHSFYNRVSQAKDEVVGGSSDPNADPKLVGADSKYWNRVVCSLLFPKYGANLNLKDAAALLREYPRIQNKDKFEIEGAGVLLQAFGPRATQFLERLGYDRSTFDPRKHDAAQTGPRQGNGMTFLETLRDAHDLLTTGKQRYGERAIPKEACDALFNMANPSLGVTVLYQAKKNLVSGKSDQAKLAPAVERVYRCKAGDDRFQQALSMVTADPRLVGVNPDDYKAALAWAGEPTHSFSNLESEEVNYIGAVLATYRDQWEKPLDYYLKLPLQNAQEGRPKFRTPSAAIHDAAQVLPIDAPAFKLKGLREFLFRQTGRARSAGSQHMVQIAAQAWDKLTPEERQLPLDEMASVAMDRNMVYDGITHKGFAMESAKWKIPKRQYNEVEERFTNSHAIASPDWTKIGVVDIHGYKGHFLPRQDVRGMYLGNYTNCCQHPRGAGAECAYHGQESQHGAFFVVENPEGEIIAQSWAWGGNNGEPDPKGSYAFGNDNVEGVCFDNCEALTLGPKRGPIVRSIYEEAARRIGATGVKSVTLGDNPDVGSDLDTAGLSTARKRSSFLQPLDYKEYRDSEDKQYVLWSPSIEKRRLSEEKMRSMPKATEGASEQIANPAAIQPFGGPAVGPMPGIQATGQPQLEMLGNESDLVPPQPQQTAKNEVQFLRFAFPEHLNEVLARVVR